MVVVLREQHVTIYGTGVKSESPRYRTHDTSWVVRPHSLHHATAQAIEIIAKHSFSQGTHDGKTKHNNSLLAMITECTPHVRYGESAKDSHHSMSTLARFPLFSCHLRL